MQGVPSKVNQGGGRSASPHVQEVVLLEAPSEALGSTGKSPGCGVRQTDVGRAPPTPPDSFSDSPTLLTCAGPSTSAVRLGCPSVPLGSGEG